MRYLNVASHERPASHSNGSCELALHIPTHLSSLSEVHKDGPERLHIPIDAGPGRNQCRPSQNTHIPFDGRPIEDGLPVDWNDDVIFDHSSTDRARKTRIGTHFLSQDQHAQKAISPKKRIDSWHTSFA